ncbi:MAG: hypothetical protein JWM71_1820, partial [Solirubrobacteraceae bacterium]|nr:hypothetical protein [Solirubrobacteraceae bacterium]
LPAHARSVPRGRAFVVRVHVPRHATRIRLRIAVVDAQGDRYAATRSVRIG